MVSYKPDSTRLDEKLDTVASQVAVTLVYCNDVASSPELPADLPDRGCVWNERADNDGLSKTLNRSCEFACALGAKHVLLLDQDGVSGEGMVSGLQACMGDGVALSSPQIADRNKREGATDDNSVVAIERAITSGALVSLDAWAAVGGLDERLFVGWVDYEFSCNLRAHNYRMVRNNGVTLLYEMGKREYAFSLPMPKGGRPFYRTSHSAARMKDKARSWVILEKKYGWSKVGCEERAYINAIKLRDLVLEHGRLQTLRAYHEGAKEGRLLMKGEEAR